MSKLRDKSKILKNNLFFIFVFILLSSYSNGFGIPVAQGNRQLESKVELSPESPRSRFYCLGFFEESLFEQGKKVRSRHPVSFYIEYDFDDSRISFNQLLPRTNVSRKYLRHLFLNKTILKLGIDEVERQPLGLIDPFFLLPMLESVHVGSDSFRSYDIKSVFTPLDDATKGRLCAVRVLNLNMKAPVPKLGIIVEGRDYFDSDLVISGQHKYRALPSELKTFSGYLLKANCSSDQDDKTKEFEIFQLKNHKTTIDEDDFNYCRKKN